MQSNKIIYYLAMFAIFCVSCSTVENKMTIQRLRFEQGFEYYYYYVCIFSNSQDSTIYLLSDMKTEQIRDNMYCDTLTRNKYYDLELVQIEKGMQVEPLGRSLGLGGFNGEVLISGDSVVGSMYTSPNIIGKCYIKIE